MCVCSRPELQNGSGNKRPPWILQNKQIMSDFPYFCHACRQQSVSVYSVHSLTEFWTRWKRDRELVWSAGLETTAVTHKCSDHSVLFILLWEDFFFFFFRKKQNKKTQTPKSQPPNANRWNSQGPCLRRWMTLGMSPRINWTRSHDQSFSVAWDRDFPSIVDVQFYRT